MPTRKPRAGFTLIELLVVVAIIALLISILLPSLKEAREQGKKAVCLANIRSIAQGMAAYASEDEAEHAIPIQQQMVSDQMGAGFSGSNFPAVRTALPFAYGGRTPQVPFPGGSGNMMTNPNSANGSRWRGRTRPLNTYLYDLDGSDENNLPLYQCPSDQGFADSIYTFDCPPEAQEIPCYDMLGNSFRFNFAGQFSPSGQGAAAQLSVGPYGHRVSTLENTGRQTAIMEPGFYTMTIQAVHGPVPPQLRLRGWHGAVMTFNVGFVDGSARTTKVEDLTRFDAEALNKMNISGDPDAWLRRGPDWSMDCYPTPAAFVPTFRANGDIVMPWASSPWAGLRGWPIDGHQENMRSPS